MQNEPDWLAGWDTCKLTPTESSSWAGYNLAFQALAAKVATLPNPPKLLAPETAGFVQLASYINNLFDRSPLYGYSHHLYNSNTGGNGGNPDGYIGDMTSFASQFADKPRMQTEFSAGETTFTDAMNLAKLMHNSLTVEEVAAYFHWDLFWGTSGAGLVSITSSTYTINPVYYAFKHYAAFTDPNWQRLEADTNSPALRISAYISPDNNQMSIVIINTSTDINIALDLSVGNFEVQDGNVYRTNSSLTEKCAFVGTFDEDTPLALPKNSITTVALRGTLIPTNCQEVKDFGHRLPSDLTGDCYVNYKDLDVISDYWLNTGCGDYNNCDGADFAPRDGIVNFFDFSGFAEQWMQCNNPLDLNCVPNW
jgi:O-glycosyl hydrolase